MASTNSSTGKTFLSPGPAHQVPPPGGRPRCWLDVHGMANANVGPPSLFCRPPTTSVPTAHDQRRPAAARTVGHRPPVFGKAHCVKRISMLGPQSRRPRCGRRLEGKRSHRKTLTRFRRPPRRPISASVRRRRNTSFESRLRRSSGTIGRNLGRPTGRQPGLTREDDDKATSVPLGRRPSRCDTPRGTTANSGAHRRPNLFWPGDHPRCPSSRGWPVGSETLAQVTVRRRVSE